MSEQSLVEERFVVGGSYLCFITPQVAHHLDAHCLLHVCLVDIYYSPQVSPAIVEDPVPKRERVLPIFVRRILTKQERDTRVSHPAILFPTADFSMRSFWLTRFIRHFASALFNTLPSRFQIAIYEQSCTRQSQPTVRFLSYQRGHTLPRLQHRHRSGLC
jgi:hypothetical protein